MDGVENGQVVSEAVQESNDLSAQSYDQEDQDLLRNANTLGKRKNASDAEEEQSPKFLESNQHSIFYGGLPNYEEGIKIDPELYTSPPKDIIELLKIKSLKSLELEIIKFKRDKLKAHLLKDITSQNSSEEDLILENIKITCSILDPEDPFTAFFHEKDSVMQQLDVSEADYRGYLIHLCLKKILVSLEDRLYYHISRRKCTNSYEQKSNGVFTVKLRKLLMEVGHLKMSGGYGHKDIPRSTWDGCCKLPIGNSYMLKEIEDRIELWQMYNPSCGILQYERSCKSIVPICYEEHCKHIFDFVVLLWDLKLRDEHNDNLFESSKLSGSLPAYPFIPNKDRYKIGIKDANEDSNLDNSPIRSGRNDKKYFES
ncbi:hypothetical protein RhiirA5_435322 [Rhizophagus irregularis]|uniref:Uncharacterized protein n=1 Tax=Rhizophagus irregularis TaxID=588596 RepID=A0A2N0NNL3_9GLOM|nr:hypothetical protein RhiirA5_435322 [Rhizophagus irregularis]PKC59968.1 hypothetical protein RhiirA1_468703 [Rhizophagus irregularis]